MQFKTLLAGLAALSLSASGSPRPPAPAAGRVQRRRLPRPCHLPRRRSARGARHRQPRLRHRGALRRHPVRGAGPAARGADGSWYQPVEFVRFTATAAADADRRRPRPSPRAARWSMRASPDAGGADARRAARLRRLRARHAEPRLRRLSRPRRARQDRRRAERHAAGHRRATSPPI